AVRMSLGLAVSDKSTAYVTGASLIIQSELQNCAPKLFGVGHLLPPHAVILRGSFARVFVPSAFVDAKRNLMAPPATSASVVKTTEVIFFPLAVRNSRRSPSW